MVNTEAGKIKVEIEKGRVKRILLLSHSEHSKEKEHQALSPEEKKIYLQIESYLKGEIKSLNFEVELKGTPFEKRVWEEVRKIPYGETITYGDLAKRLGTSPRAIGRALNKNPLPLYIPCHRVVARNGLGGFSAGNRWKAFLLQLEKFFKKVDQNT
jgi:methylated-DNA-[protein]-cysteine S-methyltransferase